LFYYRYDDDVGLWKVTIRDRPNFLATSKAPKATLVLGPQDWTIHNDSKFCSESETYHARLKLTGCADDEFTCDDAICVPMAVRCDAKGDCEDGSDETNCKTVITPVGYNRLNVPPPVHTGDTFKLALSLNLIQIVEINEIQGYFKTMVGIERNWIDRQLMYQNLKMNV
jgi:hypothetical protein